MYKTCYVPRATMQVCINTRRAGGGSGDPLRPAQRVSLLQQPSSDLIRFLEYLVVKTTLWGLVDPWDVLYPCWPDRCGVEAWMLSLCRNFARGWKYFFFIFRLAHRKLLGEIYTFFLIKKTTVSMPVKWFNFYFEVIPTVLDLNWNKSMMNDS